MTGGSYLFFYGTLSRSSANAAARAAHRRLRPRGQASIMGQLWAIADAQGWYPALIAGKGTVKGELSAAAGLTRRELAMLDSYEEFWPRRRPASVYWRETAIARDGWGRRRVVQVYRYVAKLPKGAVLIAGGDFAEWLRETGHAPYQPCRLR